MNTLKAEKRDMSIKAKNLDAKDLLPVVFSAVK